MERDIIPMAKKLNLAVAPWAVLGQGKYTGKYKKGEAVDKTRANLEMTDRDYEIADVVVAIAKEINRSPSQVALNWVLGVSFQQFLRRY
jgi:aryl-alcohol dehydrogenase-like predicted oxidoreductase